MDNVGVIVGSALILTLMRGRKRREKMTFENSSTSYKIFVGVFWIGMGVFVYRYIKYGVDLKPPKTYAPLNWEESDTKPQVVGLTY